MSIIADPAAPHSPKPFWGYRVLLMACVGMVLAGLGWVTHRSGNHPAPVTQVGSKASPQTKIASETPYQKPAGMDLLRSAQDELALNGIIQGGSGKSLALINQQVVEEGDQIQGKRVVRVEADAVELQGDSDQIKTLKLGD